MRQEEMMHNILHLQDEYMRKTNELMEVLNKTQELTLKIEHVKIDMRGKVAGLDDSPLQQEDLLAKLEGLDSQSTVSNAERELVRASESALYIQKSAPPVDAPLDHRLEYMNEVNNNVSKRLQIAQDIYLMKSKLLKEVEKSQQAQEVEKETEAKRSIFDKIKDYNPAQREQPMEIAHER